MNNLNLRFEYKIITDIDRERDDNSGYAPVPMEKIVVQGNIVTIVDIIPPNTLYKLRIKKETQDQWIDLPIRKSDFKGAMELVLQ